jgi:hypothetical protein
VKQRTYDVEWHVQQRSMRSVQTFLRCLKCPRREAGKSPHLHRHLQKSATMGTPTGCQYGVAAAKPARSPLSFTPILETRISIQVRLSRSLMHAKGPGVRELLVSLQVYKRAICLLVEFPVSRSPCWLNEKLNENHLHQGHRSVLLYLDSVTSCCSAFTCSFHMYMVLHAYWENNDSLAGSGLQAFLYVTRLEVSKVTLPFHECSIIWRSDVLPRHCGETLPTGQGHMTRRHDATIGELSCASGAS